MRCLLFILAVLPYMACKKDRKLRFTITGQLLESSRNRNPVANYELELLQGPQSGLLGNVSGIKQKVITDALGKFVITYSSGRDYGFVTTGVNRNTLLLKGTDNTQYTDIKPRWTDIPSRVDTALNILYLYKQIDTLVIKVKFNKDLAVNDTLKLRPGTHQHDHYIPGPVMAGQTIADDTLLNLRLTFFSIPINKYLFEMHVTHRYNTFNTYRFDPGDESYNEIIVGF
jgi:hypothetical protein